MLLARLFSFSTGQRVTQPLLPLAPAEAKDLGPCHELVGFPACYPANPLVTVQDQVAGFESIFLKGFQP
jgi:hypothetical protein